jgi:hypothetical protein
VFGVMQMEINRILILRFDNERYRTGLTVAFRMIWICPSSVRFEGTLAHHLWRIIVP